MGQARRGYNLIRRIAAKVQLHRTAANFQIQWPNPHLRQDAPKVRGMDAHLETPELNQLRDLPNYNRGNAPALSTSV